MKQTLWTRNFTLVTVATTLGMIGGIAGGFALSFLVFDETGSTLAAALIIAIQFVPTFILPLFLAPWMDRLPRKPFLVGGDLVNAVLYTLMGVYLMFFRFSYIGYLAYSLVLSALGTVDELAYNSIYPKLIPKGMEEKGYAVSSMLYPMMKVLLMPVAAVLLEFFGVAWLLVLQGGFSLAAALVESCIRITETARLDENGYSFRLWCEDIREAAQYLRKERGLRNIYGYMAVTNGVAGGYGPIMVAFFRTMPGFTAAMYSFFSVAEFLGRTVGSAVQYRLKLPPKKKFSFTFFVYLFYETMDMMLLWLPYPLMLVNRAAAGFLGANSATLRRAAVQRYIPEQLRARINAFENMLITAAMSILSLGVGALGEVVDYRLCLTICGAVTMLACWLTVFRARKSVRAVYEFEENS